MTKKVLKNKNSLRLKRKRRIRAKISGTAERPRLSIFKSNKHMYAQAINDVAGVTLCACDGAKAGLKANKEDAAKLATSFAGSLKEAGIETIVFDVNGFKYHGVVAAFGDELRNNGIVF
jgi:large subunit ribosomal protein L18